MQAENNNRATDAAKPEHQPEAATAKHLNAEVAAERATGGQKVTAVKSRTDDEKASAPALTSMEAIAQQSLDHALNGPPNANEVPRFADKYYAPVGGNYDFNARQAAFEANKAVGIQSVANLEVQAGDTTLRGPVTYTDSGRQVLFNSADGRKFEILPPDAANPRGSVKPLQEGRDAQPVPITQQKVVPGFGDNHPSDPRRVSDANFQLRPQPMAEPQGRLSLQQRPGETPRPGEAPRPGEPPRPAEATRPAEQPKLTPEHVAQIKQQLAEHPEWVAQLQQSKDPRAAMLLDIARRNETAARKQPPLPVEKQPARVDQPQAPRPEQTQGPRLDQAQLLRPEQTQGPRLDQAQLLRPEQTPGPRLDHVQPLRADQTPGPRLDQPQSARGDMQSGRQLDAFLQTHSDPAGRAAIISVLELAAQGRLPVEAHGAQAAHMRDLMQAIGPQGFIQLKTFLTDNQRLPLNFENQQGLPGDRAMQMRMRDFLEIALTGGISRPGTQNVSDTQSAFATLLRQNERLFNPADSAAANFDALRQLMDRFNTGRQAEALDWQQIMSRRLDGGDKPQAFSVREPLLVKDLIDRVSPRNEQAEQRITGRSQPQPLDANQTAQAAASALAGKQDAAAGNRPTTDLDHDDAQRKLKEDTARRQLEEEERTHKAAEEARRLAQIQDEQAALIAAMVKRQRTDSKQEEKEEEGVEQTKRDEDKRQKYVVREGDTLDSIAAKVLRDKHLAGLIYQINRTVIPIVSAGGKRFPQLRAKMVIWLPNGNDIQKYRSSMVTGTIDGAAPQAQQTEHVDAHAELTARFGAGWDGDKRSSLEDMDETARAAMVARRARIESMLGPLTAAAPNEANSKYVVRLGDTLKSIAIKHPLLNDVQLWKLLARVNGLSEETDATGAPHAKIRRGQILRMPTPEEVAEFTKSLSTPVIEEVKKPVARRTTSKMKTLSALAAAQPTTAKNGDTVAATGGSEEDTPRGYSLIRKQGTARVLSAGDLRDARHGLRIVLESLTDGKWMPVVVYEIYQDVSVRHEYKLDGSRKTIRIDLPPPAAAELAHNDVATNMSEYCRKFSRRSAP